MVPRLPLDGMILGLDVGDKRIGLAIANTIAKLPRPLEVLPNDQTTIDAIKEVIKNEAVSLIVVGIPRNLEGSETPQTQKIRDFVENLRHQINLPVEFADETLSSVRAREALQDNRNKEKISVDSLAACFILDEFFANIEQG